MGGGRKSYPKQFKIDAVKLVTAHEYKALGASKNLAINHDLIRRWKKDLDSDDTQAILGKSKMSAKKKELLKLRKENKQLRVEKEILKRPQLSLQKSHFEI